MDGHPEQTRTNLELIRHAQPRAARSHALPVTVVLLVITLFVAASLTPTTRSGVALVHPREPHVGSTLDQGPNGGGLPTPPDPRSSGPSAIGTSSAPPATSVAPIPSPSPSASMPPLPACRYADEPAAHAAYDDWQRTIIDTTSRLPKGYVPPDLVSVSRAGLSGRFSIRSIAVADLKALVGAGRKAGVRLAVESAYRSEARQKRTFARWVRTSGKAEARRFSARAGHSEHQLGTAIDFKAAGGGSPWTPAFARSRHARWLAANAWRFGWIQSYPPDAQAETCYGAEAWHYRYVGRDVAAEVHASGMTLRAWLWLHAMAE